jgi:Na+-driven multidrug efflux pump
LRKYPVNSLFNQLEAFYFLFIIHPSAFILLKMSLSFFSDKHFFRAMLALAVPVAFQQLITAGLNMIDVLMVGQLGEASVAALGLANQIFFLLILFLFGITSECPFSPQYWGKGDTKASARCGVCLVIMIRLKHYSHLVTLILGALMS